MNKADQKEIDDMKDMEIEVKFYLSFRKIQNVCAIRFKKKIFAVCSKITPICRAKSDQKLSVLLKILFRTVIICAE